VSSVPDAVSAPAVSGRPIVLFSLHGRAALVTGGGKGLGLAMATALASQGAAVCLSGRHEDVLREACTRITRETASAATFVVADQCERAESRRLAEAAIASMGRVDILVNNAGTNDPQAIDEITDDTWDRIVELNLSSAMALSRAVVPGMKERRWGRIIHITSVMGIASYPGRSVYSATKAGLIGMTKASALDVGPFGITVNCIAPGPFLTDLPRKVFSQEVIDAVSQRTAVLRWGEPSEMAGPVLLLASDAGSFITGSTLLVDGGALTRTM
jgi:NAD(P)-dependent dehydrogenase (short-subunit alcohol dehydrogenase family)